MDYGRAIRVARTAKNISQKELARLTELSSNYISMIESGKRMPSMDALHSIARAMDVPVYLLALLGSDQEDLRGISAEGAGIISKELLEVVVGSDRRGKDP